MSDPNPSDPIQAARAEAESSGVERAAAAADAPGQRSGDVIDRYKLVEEIGEGGMGSVWMAEQKEPVQRNVALKIIKLGMDTREVVVRFEAERQALALMDHAHIAKVFDGGATAGGRPYFVMELVAGKPITDYCDGARLGLRERLELFAKVCGAIQHAHQKGIIHRDIKPSNVLVSKNDGLAVPKVIDFGIAKATSAELTQKTLFTQQAQLIGTPEYMAPEQAELSGIDIDTRADVYALGALLYEMLTGSKLFEMRKVLEAGFEELLRTIREVDAPRPSTRVSTLGDQARSIATDRQVDVGLLSKRLAGDLDWIVMKALEKDRTRRYETVSAFAADVQRFLNQEPVVAAPPSTTYRLGKFIRRRKKTVAAVTTIALLVVAGSIGTGVGLWRSVQANRKLAVAEAEAVTRADQLERVVHFQAGQLRGLDPELMGVRLRRAFLDESSSGAADGNSANDALNFTNLSLRFLSENLFDRSIDAIDREFADQPDTRARLLRTLGVTLMELGLVEGAEDPLQRAVVLSRESRGAEDPATLAAIADLGSLHRERGELDVAERELRDSLEICRSRLDDGNVTTLATLSGLALVLQDQGRFEEAEPLLREALQSAREELGSEHPDTQAMVYTMGALLGLQGKLVEAEVFIREAYEVTQREHGPDDPKTVETLHNLATLTHRQGRHAEAMDMREAILEARRESQGDDHPHTLNAILHLGMDLAASGDLEPAGELLREGLGRCRRVLGNTHPTTLVTLKQMGVVMQQMGDLAGAAELMTESLAGSRRLLGDDHPDTMLAISDMGFNCFARRDFSGAETHWREALERVVRYLGDDYDDPASVNLPNPILLIYNIGTTLLTQRKYFGAKELLRDEVQRLRQVRGPEHPDTRELVARWKGALEREVGMARGGAGGRRLADLLACLGSHHLQQGDYQRAQEVLVESQDALFESGEMAGLLWNEVQTDLGSALAGLGYVGDAEELMAESARWSVEHLADPNVLEEHPRARALIECLVEFYDTHQGDDESAGFEEQAAEWRAELTKDG